MLEEHDKYFMILNEDNYKEFCDIAEENNDFLLKTVRKELMRDDTLMAWFVELNKTQFCMVICELRQLRSKTELIPVLIRQGENQDKEFKVRLATVDRDCHRYNLLNH